MLNKVSCTRISVKIALISYWNDFSLIPWGRVLLRRELRKYAQNSNFESALYSTSGSMPLISTLSRDLKVAGKKLWKGCLSVVPTRLVMFQEKTELPLFLSTRASLVAVVCVWGDGVYLDQINMDASWYKNTQTCQPLDIQTCILKPTNLYFSIKTCIF